MKKRSFILLELMIALTIIAVLLGALFTSLWETILLENKIEKIKSIVIPRHRLFLRLTQLFSDALSWNEEEDRARFVIKHNNFIDADPRFRGLLTSSLYIENHKLFLATESKIGKTRIECLLDKAEKFSVVSPTPGVLKIVVDTIEFPIFL